MVATYFENANTCRAMVLPYFTSIISHSKSSAKFDWAFFRMRSEHKIWYYSNTHLIQISFRILVNTLNDKN